MAATNPDTAAMTWQYAVGVIAFGLIFAGLIGWAAWLAHRPHPGLIERWLDRQLRRRVTRALDHGDQQIRAAVEEHEHAYRTRRAPDYTVPRQLTKGRR